jgi:hypothetical protein
MERWKVTERALRAVKGNREFENSENIIRTLIDSGLISKRQTEKARLSSLLTTLYFDFSGKKIIRSLNKEESKIVRNHFKKINKLGVYNVARTTVCSTNAFNEQEQGRYEEVLKFLGFNLNDRYTGEYIQNIVEKEGLKLQAIYKKNYKERFQPKFKENTLKSVLENYAKRNLSYGISLDVVKIGLDHLIDTAFRKNITKEEKDVLINHILQEVTKKSA